MRAVEFTRDRTARVVDRDVPDPRPGEVLVRVTSAGLCGSDLSALRGSHPFRAPPLITGHEGGGTVVVAGQGVDEAWVGRAVALEPQRACAVCDACAAGLPHLCRDRLMLGMPGWPGTLSEYVTAPTTCLHLVDPGVPPGLLALAEPLAVDVHALSMAPALDGARVAVLGGGPIGALLVHLARARGAAHVAATDPRASSRAACTALGAHATADPSAPDRHDALGAPFDVVFVAAAAPGVLDEAGALLRPRGTIVQVGMFGTPQTVDLTALQRDEKALVGTITYTATDFAEAARELGRSWSALSGLVTDGGGLDGAVAHLHDRVAGRPDDVIKLLVRP